MKRNFKKKFKVLTMTASLAACGCSVVEGSEYIGCAFLGFAGGAAAVYLIDNSIESKVYYELDSALDKVGLPNETLQKLKCELHKQIGQKFKKDGKIKTIRSLLKIADVAEKCKDEKNLLTKINLLSEVLNSEGFSVGGMLYEATKGLAQDLFGGIGNWFNW